MPGQVCPRTHRPTHFSSFGSSALCLDPAGADGLVLFNRWIQPEIDLGVDAAPGLLAVPTDVDASGYGRAGDVSALEKTTRTNGRVDA